MEAPAWRVWWRLAAFARPDAVRLALALVAGLVGAAAASAWAWLLGPLAESLLLGGAASGPWLALAPPAIVAAALVKAASFWLQGGLTAEVAQRTLGRLRRALHGHLLDVPPAWLQRQHSGELLSRFVADVAQVELAVSSALTSWVKDVLQVLGLLLVCLAIDARLSLLAFVVLPGMVVPVSRFARAARRAAQGAQASLGALLALVADQLGALQVVQAYRGEQRALARLDEEQARLLALMDRSLFIRGAFTPVTEFLGVVGVVLALLAGARAVAVEPAFAPRLVSFLAAALLVYQPVKALTGTASQVSVALGAARRLFEVLDAPVARDEGPPVGPLAQALRLEGLGLTYADGTVALDGVSLTVPAGQTVALVGPSGAGKTSVFLALLGLARETSGRITWDGVDVSLASRASLRAQVAWVPQEVVLLSGTVRDNVLLGRPEATEAEVWRALREAHAEAFVRELPGGLDAPVGERGQRLSGGQRQRLGLARAYLKAPSLLLLDEATSALDAVSEAAVQASLAALVAGRTVLLIAHRLATVERADLVVVLEAGQVVDLGRPEELRARPGTYQRLLQALEEGARQP